VEVTAPGRWQRGEMAVFHLTLENPEMAREIRVHYREADQNREFRLLSVSVSRSGDHQIALDTALLDDAYELLVFFEVIDVFGRGHFYPDPFDQARYFVLEPGP